MKKIKRFLMVFTLMFCFSLSLASCKDGQSVHIDVRVDDGKTEPTVEAPTAKTLVYNGDAQILINAGSTSGGIMLYKLAGGKYSEELPSVMAAGTYKVYYKVTGDDTYKDVAEKSIDVTIAKATPAVTAPTAKTLTETSEAQVLVNKGTTTGGTLQYKLGDNGIYSTELPKAKAAGTYTVYYKVVGDDNYNDVAEASINVTIAASSTPTPTPTPTKTDPVVTLPTAKTLTYTGSAQELINAGTTTGGTLQYKLDNGTYGTSIPTATNAGTYTIYYKVVGNDEFNDVAEQSIIVTIAKATPTVTAPTAKILTANGSAQELINAASTTAGTIQYKLGENGTYGETIPSATEAGSYKVYYKVVGNDNYNDVEETYINASIDSVAENGKINPTVVAPTPKTLTANGSAQELVNAGSTTGGTLVYMLGALGTYSESIPQATDAGTYTVYYKVIGNDDYNDVEVAYVEVTIAPQQVTPKTTPIVTAPEAKTLTYNGQAQELVNAGSTTGGTLVYMLGPVSTFAETIPTAIDTGTYTIYYKVIGNDEYNDVAEAHVTVTIAKATPTVTKPTANSITYDGNAHELVASGDTTGGTLVYKLGNGTYSEDIPEATDAGTYTVYYKVVGDSNYNDVAEATVIVTISQASSSNNLAVNSITGSNESIIVEFPVATGKTNEDYVVKYSKDNNTYKEIDKELILIDNQVAKAYIVGLEAGDYYIKVEEAETPTNYYLSSLVQVSAQDRSGYAHFNYTEGVGAYNDDGTLKTGTVVIYVSDATKNTVTYGSYVGLVSILSKLNNINNPVCIRFLDTVKTTQWDSKTYSSYSEAAIKADYGETEPTDGKYYIDKLLAAKANTINTDLNNGITTLNGLEKFSYGTTKDSYWNMCDIKNASNVTLEGIGTDAGLYQWGLTWKNCSSIEIKNLLFDKYTEDACSFEGSTDSPTLSDYDKDSDGNYIGRIWVHNNTFTQGLNRWDVSDDQDKHEGDGATDFKRTGNITVSYNYYIENHKTGLVGSDDGTYTANVTFHHNYYERCNSRMPLGRNANMHMYNNYYYGTTGTNMSIRARGYAFVENCVLENCKNPFECKTGTKKTSNGVVVYDMTPYTGVVKSYNNTLINCTNANNATVVTSRTQTVTNSNSYGQSFDTDSTIFYYENNKSDVSILTETSNVKTFALAHAGAGATYYGSLELYAEPSVTPTPTDTKSITMNSTSYDTIAAALAAIPTNSTDTFTITLSKGTYNENGLSYNGKATIIISGDTTTKYGTDVIIKGHGSNMTQESTRNLITFSGSGNIILENLTLESDWSRANHSGDVQAEVLGTSNTGYTAAYNCSFKSHQDTLRTTGKAWFYDCYIEGDVDFIWMEQQGIVALYENCEIVSVYDTNATNHTSYVVAPRMSITDNVGKGVVIFNSTITEENASQTTYLARTPWSSGYYNQAAFINTTCTGVEAAPWFNASITTTYPKTVIGWKMDAATKTSIGYAGTSDVLDSTTVANEFSGRKAILNRIYNTTSNAYQKDTNNYWDIDSFITTMGWTVASDTSKDLLDGEAEVEVITYNFDGSTTGTGTVYTYTGEINGTTGTFGNLSIDATTGKLTARTSDSQFNQGAKISFVATKNGTLTITNHPGYHNYTIKAGDAAAVAATEDETTITIESGVTYVIEASNTTYLFKLIIVQ